MLEGEISRERQASPARALGTLAKPESDRRSEGKGREGEGRRASEWMREAERVSDRERVRVRKCERDREREKERESVCE